MRCKVGDVCLVVGPNFPQNQGRVVTILRPARHEYCEWYCVGRVMVKGKEVEGAAFTDASLRPIRDNDGTDETLTWKEVPKEYAHG